jgi:arginase family enzyme
MGANRALDPEEVRYQRENGVVSLSVEELEENPAALAEAIRARGIDAAYVHINLDCLDPRAFSLMPVPEPDGLRCNTLLEVVRAIADACELRGFSIMEYCGTAEDADNELLGELVGIGLGI